MDTLQAADVEALAARAPALDSPAAQRARRCGAALRVFGQALAERGLPELHRMTFFDREDPDGPVHLLASAQQVGDLPAVAAWAAAYGGTVQVYADAEDKAAFRRRCETTVVLAVAEDVLLSVWTVLKVPTHDQLVDLALAAARGVS